MRVKTTRVRRIMAVGLAGTMALATVAAGASADDQRFENIVQTAVTATTEGDEAPPVDPGYGTDELPEAPSELDGVLISEVANGGPGNPASHAENFMELTNYGDEPVDISGWYFWRCGQSGDGYGPQQVIEDGTVLAPGEQYTIVREGSQLEQESFVDGTYDVSLHPFGFGAWLMTPDEEVVDRIGVYHESIHSHCGVGETEDGMPQTLHEPLSWAHGESIQRVDATGDIYHDWIIAERTPGAPNTDEPSNIVADRDEVGDILISEYALGGSGDYINNYIELVNAGDDPVDISGWKVYRCGNNSQTYAQSHGLPEGSVLAPGETFLLAREGTDLAAEAPVTYGTSMSWINSGAMVLTEDDQIVDRMSVYPDDRISPCTDGDPKLFDLTAVLGESYQRVSDTGNNAEDFVAALQNPGEWVAEEDLEMLEIDESAYADDIWVTELVGSGPGGSNDNFVELTNVGDDPVDMTDWTLYRCEGSGRMSGQPQIDGIDVVLEPGETYLAADQSAPAALLAVADDTYAVGFNQTDGYGVVVFDDELNRVEGVGVYDTIEHDGCGTGLTLQNNTRDDEGISYQRAAFNGEDSYHEFVKAERNPGTYVEHEWVDVTVPTDEQLAPDDVERSHRPATPVAAADGAAVSVTTDHAGAADLDVSFRTAEPIEIDAENATVYAGTTDTVPPESREIEGEELIEDVEGAVADGYTGQFPFQRFEVEVESESATELIWSGNTSDRNELQLFAFDGDAWVQLDAAVPSADGDITLIGELEAAYTADGNADVLIIDGPRTEGGLLDEVGVTDQAFSQPGTYDFAVNHMTDTQFYSEGFVDVFTDMTAWVAANKDTRDIAYSFNTGDIIENWMRGFADPERARREFRDASAIIGILNAHGVANGVLPGNHDNFWGRNNAMYNEYFGPQMFEDEAWWGNSWQEGDNSAHYDWFYHDGVPFMVLHLQYMPSDAQIAWANEVAQANPEFNIILGAHSYLYTDAELEDIDRRHSARGRHIWEDLVVPNDNIFMVKGGHYHGVATNYADPVTGERVEVSDLGGDTLAHDNVGESGRRVVEMLANYQGYRSSQPSPRNDFHDRDTGFQRLLQFDLDAGLMGVNTYSPHLDEFDAWKYDEPAFRAPNERYGPDDDEFVVEVDLRVPSAFSTTGWTVQTSSSEVATTTVGAGETATHDFDEDATGNAWYAVVTEAGSDAGNTGESAVTFPALLGDDQDGPGEPGDPQDPDDPQDPAVPVCDDVDSEVPFDDVNGSGHDAFIACLAELGVVEGYGDGTFGPTDDVSRAQLASFVVRALETAGHELTATDASVPDVSANSTHGEAIYQLAGAGVIQGYTDGSFGPWDSVSREQTATYVSGALELVVGELPTSNVAFDDVAAGATHAVAINKLATSGVIAGFGDGTFGPTQPVTRAQMTRFIGNGLDVLAAEASNG